MDIVERCNLRCDHCPFVKWRDRIRPGAEISDEVLDRLEKEVFPNASKVTLSGFHEPLMNPELLIRGIESCYRAEVPVVDFVTNGLLFTETTAREIMERGVSRIFFSVDGASSRTYDRMRTGGYFTTFVDKLSMISRMRKELRLANRLTLSFICVMRHSNIQEAPDLMRLAARYDVDIVELRYMMKVDVSAAGEDELVIHHQVETDLALDEAAALAVEEGITLELTPGRFRDITEEDWKDPPKKKLNCKFPWNSVVISPRGEIFGCCFWNGNDPLADLHEARFSEIWNGEAFRKLRYELTTGEIRRKNCRDCIVHFTSMADSGYWNTRTFNFVPEKETRKGQAADREGWNYISARGRRGPASR